ncbi:MAG: GGDEF domain-containing protein, partial [Peptococcaceae bacterium]|nr:GGDEF domain-containing protein [Peptococcaceae bacterium]
VWISSVAFFIGNGAVNKNNSLRTTAFNMSQQILTLYVTVFITGLIWGKEINTALLMETPYAGAFYLVVFIVLYFIINHIFVYIYTSPDRDGLRIHSWKDTLRWDGLSYLFTTPFGVVMAILYSLVGLGPMLLLVVPVLAVQLILRRYIRTELVNRELRAVYEINKALGDNPSLKEIPEILLSEMQRAINFHTGIVYLRTPEGRHYSCAGVLGPYSEQLEKDIITSGEGFFGWTIENGEPDIVFNSRIDPRVKSDQGLPQVFKSLMVIPLPGEIGPLGLVVIGEKKALSFSEGDLAVAVSLSGRVTVSLINEIQQERLEILKRRDPVTGLLNRKVFVLKGRQAFEKKADYDEKRVALALLDLDILGHINDGWGQEVGDAMIYRLGNFLGSLESELIFVGRFGDDEFSILFLEHDEEMAMEFLEKIRDDFARYQFSEDYPLLRIKFSIGLAVAPQDGKDFDQLLKGAGKALAKAKKNGRDQIVTMTALKGRLSGRSKWLT